MNLLPIIIFTGLFSIGSPAAGAEGRMIELILDASGSMNARLPGGKAKIEAARSAVEKLLTALPAGITLAFRAYGHQSPRAKHDCRDTQLLVPFGDAGAAKSSVLARARAVQAQGYTPITFVLQTAAADFPSALSGERTIILVSDGQETCEGDPCAAARALRASGVKLVVHTIGFEVDDGARLQLKCLAGATGGSYFDAGDADQLAIALGKAAAAESQTPKPEEKGAGWLTINHAGLQGHEVTDATTGRRMGSISFTHSTLELPAGIYNASFGGGSKGKEGQIWKSIEVKAGKTTVLDPGVLQVVPAALVGHSIADSETGVVYTSVGATQDQATLMPGTYDVSFGKIFWRNVRVRGGDKTVLSPGSIKILRAHIQGHMIHTADGVEVGSVSATGNWMPLPPGDYTVQLGTRKVPFSIAAGKVVELENR